MRSIEGFLVAALIVVPLFGGLTPHDPLTRANASSEGPSMPTDAFNELSVEPAPDAWLNVSRPTIVVRITNSSFAPLLEWTVILLDGRRLVPEWDATLRSVRATPADPLLEGVHSAEVSLRDETGRVLQAVWSFQVDTEPPRVDFDPVPSEADRRVFAINGTVAEANLVDVRVNGFTAVIEGNHFSVPVLLWPGRNDLLAVARDRANNAGLAAGVIEWFPAAPSNMSYVTVFHANASFTIRVPADWVVETEVDLEGGFRAQLVVQQPEIVDLRTTIAVVSRLVGDAMSRALLLTILEDSIRRVSADSTVYVVGSPVAVDLSPGTFSAQFSVVETLPEGPRIFRLVTGFWSQRLSRIWLVLGSASTEAVEGQWHAIQTAVVSFRAVAPASETQTGNSPQAAIDRAFFVTLGGIVVLLIVFGVALRSVRAKPRNYSFLPTTAARSRSWLRRWDSRQSRIWRRR